MSSYHRRVLAELIGTFVLVFAGTGAIIVNEVRGGAVTHPGIALTFGLTVLATIYAFGDISGAHLNPAVTIGFWRAHRFPGREVIPYCGAQLSGAILASTILRWLFGNAVYLGTTIPSGSYAQSFVLEVILTWFLMLVILHVSTGAKEKGITAGIAIGAVVGLEAMFAGPISGASMNPARSLGPAAISGNIEHLWIYIAAPMFGAMLAVPTCRSVQEVGCCCKPSEACQ